MDTSGLQLLPGTKKRLGIKVPGENRFLYIGSAILGATLVSMFALARYETSLISQVDQLNKEIVSLEEKRNKRDEVELRLIKDRLTLTSDLIKNHVYWTQAFSWFESSLQSDIQIKDLSRSFEGAANFKAVATSYIVVARQVAAFLADDRVLDITLGKINATSDGIIEFDGQLKLDWDRILKK